MKEETIDHIWKILPIFLKKILQNKLKLNLLVFYSKKQIMIHIHVVIGERFYCSHPGYNSVTVIASSNRQLDY